MHHNNDFPLAETISDTRTALLNLNDRYALLTPFCCCMYFGWTHIYLHGIRRILQVVAAALESIATWLQRLSASAAAALAHIEAGKASGGDCSMNLCYPPVDLLQLALGHAARRLFDSKEVMLLLRILLLS